LFYQDRAQSSALPSIRAAAPGSGSGARKGERRAVNEPQRLRDDEPRVGDAASHEEAEAARKAVEAVARRSYGRLVARLAARTRDVVGTEDALSDAFVAALVDRPAKGIPRSPEAWLVAVARRKWIDAARRRRSAEDAWGHLRLVADEIEAAAAADARLPDERLALMFACAHPAIHPRIRAPLILQTILGLDAAAEPAARRLLFRMLHARGRRLRLTRTIRGGSSTRPVRPAGPHPSAICSGCVQASRRRIGPRSPSCPGGHRDSLTSSISGRSARLAFGDRGRRGGPRQEGRA
jgi:DNA-directed RNA polymerase specialized sigma24 family protein